MCVCVFPNNLRENEKTVVVEVLVENVLKWNKEFLNPGALTFVPYWFLLYRRVFPEILPKTSQRPL